jgi:uncharacterized protein (DUF1800 family)
MALHRFGLGPRPGAIVAVAQDPRAALRAEIDQPDAGRIEADGLMSSAAASRSAFNFREEQQAKRIAQQKIEEARNASDMAENLANSSANNAVMTPDKPEMGQSAKPAQPNVVQRIFLDEAKARFDAAAKAEVGFVERLVWFWSNHFCVSADAVPALAGGYEREAIRPYVLGRFADMLQAVESHPAMLSYLNNAASLGPNSVAGLIQKRGLNENLARETLELHTLGVRSGYTQDDVTRYAKVITGWTIKPPAIDPEHGSEFIFNARLHEPGPQTVLGRSYDQPGVAQGRAVLADLARHPATAAHIATKLAIHFASDDPPQPLIDRLATRFRDTDGDLKEMALALIEAPECWSAPQVKLKKPSEWLAAVVRISGVEPEPRRLVQGQALLGEPLWRPPAPAGFADRQDAWLNGLAQRLDIANQFATRVAAKLDPDALVDEALGPLASDDTRNTVARAESRAQALTLLLMAPEFQRR